MFNFIKGALGYGTKPDLCKYCLTGILSVKEIGHPINELSPECELRIHLDNPTTSEYSLLLTNTENVDNWKELSFPISCDCHFKKYLNNSNQCIIWEKNRSFYIFEILIDSDVQDTTEAFLNNLSATIRISEYGPEECDKHDDTFIDNYDELDDVDAFLESNYKHYKIKEVPSEIDEITSDINNIKVSYPEIPKEIAMAKNLFRGAGGLFTYNDGSNELKLIADNSTFNIYCMDENNYVFGLVVEQGNYLISYDTFSGNTTYQIMDNCFMWVSHNNSEQGKPLCFSIDNADLIHSLSSMLIKIRYETVNKMSYESIPEEEREWLEKENTRDESMVESEEDIEIEFDDNYDESNSEKKNKFTTQAYLHDRTFCVKDDNTISVYKTDDYTNSLNLLMNLPPVQEFEGKEVNLKKRQMFLGDTNILFLDKNNQNSLYQYDILKSKIVSEWNVDTGTNNSEIVNIAPDKKMAQMTESQMIYGLNSNNIFALDGRLNKKNKVVDVKSYKANPKMICIASSGFGGFATGSLDGQIRLYDEVGKNAKNIFQGYGDAIKGIDITDDGRFILATCDWYLLLISTVPKGSNQNAFMTRLNKNRPPMKTLKLKVLDITRYGLENQRYTVAKFNVSKKGETNIITSLGEYVIIWNFAKIKKGILDDYKIQKVNQFVIDNQFKYDKNQVVVTMPNNLRIQNQKTLFD